MLSGGPCTYRSETMQTSHEGLDIRDAEFNAVVEDLIKAMDELEIPAPLQNELIALLAPLHRDIVHQ